MAAVMRRRRRSQILREPRAAMAPAAKRRSHREERGKDEASFGKNYEEEKGVGEGPVLRDEFG